MDLMDLLESAGGSGSIGALAKQLGIGGGDAGKLVGALAPALMRGLQKQAESPDSLEGFTKAINSGRHQQYLDKPELMASEDARADGNSILGHLFGSKDVSRNVAAQAAESSGLSASLLKKALPMLAGLAMGALSKKGQSSPGGFDIGSLAGAITGGGDGFGIDDVLNIARKFF